MSAVASIHDGGSGDTKRRRRQHLEVVDDGASAVSAAPWPILVVDDEEDIHRLVRLILDSVTYDGRPVEILSAYSAVEARRVLAERSVSVVLLDVMMETDTAGLDLVDHIRTNLDDQATRIVIVTGQPGVAPELEVVNRYDIDGYVNKSELRSEYLSSLVVTSLRVYDSYRTIAAMAREQRRLVEALVAQNEQLDQTNRRLRDELAVNAALRDDLGSVDGRIEELVARRVHELELQTERAELANAVKTDFITSMNHELRNPLQAILGHADMLLTADAASRAEADLNAAAAISRAGEHMLAIVNDILDLTAIESGTRVIEIGPAPIERACREAIAVMKPLATERQIDFGEDLGDQGLEVLGNEQSITQVLINLISNAIKYNRPQGHVDVVVRRLGDAVEVAVSDSGIGIPAELIDRILLPFERLSTDEAGTGVGLTITQRLLDEMGTELTFSSVEGEGSTFGFRLPLAP